MNWSSSKGFITRALPFAATFLIAVFITSLFVDLNGPRMRGFHGKRHHEMKRLRIENQDLRQENERLKLQLEGKSVEHMSVDIKGREDCQFKVFDIPVTPKAQK